MDLGSLTWESLTGISALALFLVVLIELAKRGKLLAGTRAILVLALVMGQGFAQAAFWRCKSPWSAQVAADAFLVGLVSAVLAVGGHSIVKKIAEKPPP